MSLDFVLAVIGLLLIAWIGFTLLGLVVPDADLRELESRWAPPPSQWITVEGLRVHLRDEGPTDTQAAPIDPTPIVLIHGTGASLHTWDAWAEGLRSERRVVRFDLPGFGLTGPRPDADYSIEAHIRFTVALLDALQIERCVLAGNSLGGEIA